MGAAVVGGLDDEGARDAAEVTQNFGIGRRRCFKNVSIRAIVAQATFFVARPGLATNQTFESQPKAAAQGAPFERGERKRVNGL